MNELSVAFHNPNVRPKCNAWIQFIRLVNEPLKQAGFWVLF